MYSFKLPLRIPVSSKKDFILNLNNYRNAHYHTLNKSKVNYTVKVLEIISASDLPKDLGRVELEFVLYPGNARKMDVSNICSIVEKYFNDALVQGGYLEDDNYLFVPKSSYSFGGIDREDPRVEVTINILE